MRGRVVAGGAAGGPLPGCCLPLPGASTSLPASAILHTETRPLARAHSRAAAQCNAMLYSLTQNKATCLYAKLEVGCCCEPWIFRIFWMIDDGVVFCLLYILVDQATQKVRGRVTSWTPPCTLTKLALSDTQGAV